MDASTRPARSLPKAPVLLLVLAITTGWGDSTAAYGGTDAGIGTTSAGPTLDHGEVTAPARFGLPFDLPLARSSRLERPPLAEPKPAKAEKAQQPKVAKPARVAKPVVSKPPTAPSRPRYAGENHFWIPSLGISKRVHLFPCERQRPPDNYMYRWGCAGTNNVYIMGHAYSVMEPLHDAYVRGTLKVGMVAIYANANGRVTRYRVTSWRVVDPVDSHWAIADQPVPSMTLQTCVGKDGRYRLNVRLVAV